jgi:hypothetical protein
MQIQGATVTLNPAAPVFYGAGGSPLPNASATSTASDGLAFGQNVTAGSVTATAVVGAQTFPSRTFTVVAGGLTIVDSLRP